MPVKLTEKTLVPSSKENTNLIVEQSGIINRVPIMGMTDADLQSDSKLAGAKAVGDALAALKAWVVEKIGSGDVPQQTVEYITAAIKAVTDLYDPQGYKQDVFLYSKAKADAVQDNLDSAVSTLNGYIGAVKTEIQATYNHGGSDCKSLDEALNGLLSAAKHYAETYTRAALAEYKAFTVKIVTALPDIGEKQTFYLVPKSTGYEKYWWILPEGESVGRWDSFGSSSTLVVDSLPSVGDPDVDYILKDTFGYSYYKYIGGKWELIAGSKTAVVDELPETGNESTDYYLRTEGCAYVHYRWIDGAWACVGGDISSDPVFIEMQEAVADIERALDTDEQLLNNVHTQLEAQKSFVMDVVKYDDYTQINYGDGNFKRIPDKDTAVTVEDIDETEDGYRITYTNGDTKELAGKGSGGGGTSGGAAITRLGETNMTCVYGDNCTIPYNFNAFDASGETVGAGAATWYVNGIIKATGIAYEGDNSFDIGPYLAAGSCNVKISVSVDTGGEKNTIATKTWTVNAVNMYMDWTHDDTSVYTTDTVIRWTPYGDLDKTTHILVDGVEIGTSVTSRSGVLQAYNLSKLHHGAHLVQLYMTGTVNSIPIRTQVVSHDYIFADEGNTTPIIGSSYTGGTMMQYNTMAIPIVIYDPVKLTADAKLYIDGEEIADWTGVDRTIHYWNYSPVVAGQHTLRVAVGDVQKTFVIDVTELDIDNEEVSGYSFRMKASDLAGNDALKAWSSGGVTASFSENFDWVNGGIQSDTDSDGNVRQLICVKAGTSMTIHHMPFASDCTAEGKNLKVIFRLSNCRDYDAKWLDCYNSGIGVRMYANSAELTSEQSAVSVPYYESTPDPIELEFDIWPKSNFAYIMPWIDGVQAGVKVYPSNDAFVQTNPQDITIGSDDCDVYLYMIKSYPNYLTNDNHLENFVADAPNAQEMLERYNRNNIRDSSGEISYLKTAQANPDLRVHVYDIVELFKGDKEAAAVTGNSYRMFLGSEDQQNAIYSAENVSMKIQGTSSVGYYDACANWDEEYKGGVTDRTGKIQNGISMTDKSMMVSYMNSKVNEASCEGSNNAVLAQIYHEFQPYIRPYRAGNEMVRDTMEFQPGVAFFRDQSGKLWDGDSEGYHLYAVIAKGNSKKNYAVFHDPDNPKECCMEVANNTAYQCLMNVECSDEDVRNDDYFEFRYPKKPTDAMFDGWKRFVNWMYASNPRAATGDPLGSAVTFEPYNIRGIDEEQADNILKGQIISTYAGTYTTDSYEYRMAKMLSECEDYLILDSVVYHYLFIERHTMIDNVAKNTFWGSHDLQHWYLCHDYDNDTADGNDNEGGLTLTYGYEAMDVIGTKNVFNGSAAVWFGFIDGLYELRRAMYINRESKGAWEPDLFIDRSAEFQRVIPERIRIQDNWYKYLRRYEQNNDDGYLDMLEGGLKTYQRMQFEKYHGAYMASEYLGSAASNDRVTIRAYTPTTSGLVVPPKNEITITMYAKSYINILVGSISKRIKAERGIPYTLTFDEAGQLNDTESYIYSASMVQAVGDISHLYPGYQAWANATRLRSLQIGSTVAGYVNYNADSISFGANRMLETLIVPNLPNATSAMDLTQCQSLKYLDARGSGFSGFSFATNGVLETAYLPRPASISLRSLSRLTDFSLESLENLTSVTIEQTPSVDSKTLVSDADYLVRVRLTGIDWNEYGTELTELMERLYLLRGRDESDADIAHAVVAGDVWLTYARENQLARYEERWPNLDVSYGSLIAQYVLTFVNDDGSVLCRQYVDRGSDGYDPVAAGEIDTPTKAATAAHTYTFRGWDDDMTTVISDRTIHAEYDEHVRSYTVTWLGANGILMKRESYEYGSEAVYDGPTPTKTDGEGMMIYAVFMGWDKSTGCITDDVTVNAIFQTAELPPVGKDLSDMNWAEIYAVKKSGRASQYLEIKDQMLFDMGYEPEFTNVESEVVASDLQLSGSTRVNTGIKLMENDEAWTVSIDIAVEGTAANACFADAYQDNSYHGFQIFYNNGLKVRWGTTTSGTNRTVVTTSVQNKVALTSRPRDIIVLRHPAGSKYIEVYMCDPVANNKVTFTLDKTIATKTSAELVLGCDHNGANFATGWIHRCIVWHADLGDAEAQKMVAWPRTHCVAEVKGVGDDMQPNGARTNVDFIFGDELDVGRGMNSTNTNTGGWPATDARTWLNDRFYNGLPMPLREMMVDVLVNSVGYGSEVLQSTDKVHIPSVREVNGNSTEPYAYCGTWASWLVSNQTRIKVFGLNRNGKITAQPSAPNNPAIGNLWVATSNDSVGYLWTGNVWRQAYNYWLRDASLSSAANFAYVSSNGNVSTGGISASIGYGFVPRFSI